MPNKSSTAKSKTAPATPIVRTSAGLRDAIFDEIDSIRCGASNPTRANAIAKLANGVVETVRMELEVRRYVRQFPDDKKRLAETVLHEPLELGSTRA